ncbi:glycosyl hydrolase 115 family protein [Bifidobacterium avesanii]|uniref:Glycosyl hydrolase family 115 n=1 Tax=Bifidobacterium avesanii TaxID=1798157 RepID=A0A7K3TIH4_9BIFI|nr:glycosyl hydrolase 115 family protein [Bifidobacterium avesanii]KAB8292870.1 Glycosyl hydrolase family [Bifidobacterium avesanii]NEG78474.1 hypothetical protein [Bifidobacterium avesanii]
MKLLQNVAITGAVDAEPVRLAIADVRRDLNAVLSAPDAPAAGDGTAADDAIAAINLVRAQGTGPDAMAAETFTVRLDAGARTLVIAAPDDLGLVYGLYHVSRDLLGVPDFWFWTDWTPSRRSDAVDVPDGYAFASKPFAVRDRGWFINDEVLLLGWQIGNDPLEPWRMAFETLLRCGGNMVIPGTGLNVEQHVPLAVARGLAIAQHHAEPLGATMFSTAYPDLNPSWDEHADKFKALWADSLRRHKGQRMIWNVGFRGQGDSPFWDCDPTYDTDESRGRLMGDIIRVQREMIKADDPHAQMCVYLYGETMELYSKGCLDLPDDVIKVWSDNGFGRMVTRRQGNHNPRVPAMPNPDDPGAQGIYYHASFYDLQAANHITTLPNQPADIARELGEVLANGGDDFWIVNSSNVKPHMYYLDLIAELWRDGLPAGSLKDPKAIGDFVDAHARRFAATYFTPDRPDVVAGAYKAYFDLAVPYGPHWDDHAGEQFWNHVSRMLVSQFVRDRHTGEGDLAWATDATDLRAQVEWYLGLCERGDANYTALVEDLEHRRLELEPGHVRRLFDDTVLLQSRIQLHCARGARKACEAMLEAFGLFETFDPKTSDHVAWAHAFYLAGEARGEYRAARAAMDEAEHGVWRGYYGNECLADVAQSAWVMEYLMSFLRNVDDGPHFYQWQREFIYSKESRKVLTILNLENHLTDDEIFDAMRPRFQR